MALHKSNFGKEVETLLMNMPLRNWLFNVAGMLGELGGKLDEPT